jgi:uncharacterized protein YecT (DUF1311 family)
MRLRLGAVGLVVLSLSFSAAVDAQTQLEMNQDADRTLRDTETKLNAAVTTYRKRLDQSQRAAFDESQRRWVAYRKAACEFQAGGVAGGSAYSMVLAACLTQAPGRTKRGAPQSIHRRAYAYRAAAVGRATTTSACPRSALGSSHRRRDVPTSQRSLSGPMPIH